MKKSWLYKEGEEARIFKGDEIEEALENGWVDTPADFKEVEVDTSENIEVVPQAIETFSDDELIAEVEERGLQELSNYSDEEILSTLEDMKEECIKRDIQIGKVIPHDIDGDGEGDVDLNDLDRDELYEMAIKAKLKVPSNIGKEKLIERLLESQWE